MQNKFAFFANFAETIRQTLPLEKQPEAYQAICEFGIYGELPEDPMLKVMCLMAKSSIYNKGGAPEGNKNALKKQPKNQPENNPETTENNPETTENNPETTENNPETTENNPETTKKEEKEKTPPHPQENKNNKKIIPPIITSDNSPPGGLPACSADDEKKYAFEGEVIRLKQKDFDDWQRAYPDLNIYAECVVRDSWLREQPESERKRWFMSTAAYFAKQNERRKRQNAELASEVDNREILGFAEPRKLTAEDIEKFMRS